ncbi:hypothetical protein XM72_c12705 [Vibrio vulnificus]|nr:hypothetical protein XM72_c12705 [Vibrio vulnificus]
MPWASLTSHLAPRTSHLAPRTSHLAPRTSHLAPRTSHLAPRTSIFTFKLNLANVFPTFCARIAPILLFLRFNTFLETT